MISKETNVSIFHSLEFVGRGSETQLIVGGNLHELSRKRRQIFWWDPNKHDIFTQ